VQPSRHNPTSPSQLARLAGPGLACVLLIVLLALPRFGHTTPDSVHYIALVEYFRGMAPAEALQAPYAHRWLLPWLAAWLPVAPDTAIALCSLASTLAAYGCFARVLTLLFPDRTARRNGMLVLIVSFPTLNYGSAVLTDSAGFLILAAAAWALLARRSLILGLVLTAGIGVRETTLLMLPVIWIFHLLERNRSGLKASGFITITVLLAVAAARWWFADLPAYLWIPSWARLVENLTRPVSWATVSLTILPVGALALAGLRHWPAYAPHTRHFILATLIPGLGLLGYSIAAAWMSGRFCWPLYLALVPLAACAGAPPQNTSVTSPTPPEASCG
jgi:hypothetical protein